MDQSSRPMALLQERRKHSGLLHSLYDVGEKGEVAQATMKGEGVRELAQS